MELLLASFVGLEISCPTHERVFKQQADWTWVTWQASLEIMELTSSKPHQWQLALVKPLAIQDGLKLTSKCSSSFPPSLFLSLRSDRLYLQHLMVNTKKDEFNLIVEGIQLQLFPGQQKSHGIQPLDTEHFGHHKSFRLFFLEIQIRKSSSRSTSQERSESIIDFIEDFTSPQFWQSILITSAFGLGCMGCCTWGSMFSQHSGVWPCIFLLKRTHPLCVPFYFSIQIQFFTK